MGLKPDPMTSCGTGATGSDTDDRCIMLNTEPSSPHMPKGEFSGSWPSSHCLLWWVKLALYTVSLREGKNTNCCSTSSLLIPGTKQKTREGAVNRFKSSITSCSALSSLQTHTCYQAAHDQHSSSQFPAKSLSDQDDTPGEEDTACSVAYKVPAAASLRGCVTCRSTLWNSFLFHPTVVNISILINKHGL